MKPSRTAIQIVIGSMSLMVAMVMIVAYKMYNKPHRAVDEEVALVTNAAQLFEAFEQNEVEANRKYLDKVVEVTGRVSEVTMNMDHKPIIVLETGNLIFGVRCTMNESTVPAETGSMVTIKGICTGYLSDVVITNGILKK